MNHKDTKTQRTITEKGVNGVRRGPSRAPFFLSVAVPSCLRVFVVILLPLFPLPANAAATSAEAAEKAVAVQKYYDQAFVYYKNGDYGKAITTWDEILRLDPAQKTARDMIVEVQKNIETQNARRLAAVTANIKLGRYRSALSGLDTLLENGLRTTFAAGLKPQLEELAQIVPAAPDKNKPWRLAVSGLDSALAAAPDLRSAYDALRYARELDPSETRFKRLLEWFQNRHPETVKNEAVTPGMTLLEYKRSLALDHLYGARYHEAIDTLDEVLALEPNDLVALKRLGSAYYSINLHDKAREAWSKALALTPDDPELKKFLKKLAARPARRTTN